MTVEQVSKKYKIIRTMECDLCGRFDSIRLKVVEIEERVASNSLQIGSHMITHGDHIRIAYFDIDGDYLGDTISLNIRKPMNEFTTNLDVFRSVKQGSVLTNVRKRLLGLFINQKQDLVIVGPSLAGKTSLSIFLETGIPEKYSERINHSPTMGKSVKRFRFGKSNLTIFDFGGQRDFWSQWSETISSSKKIIFVLDVTAQNKQEVLDALSLVLDNLDQNADLLVMQNKIDLIIEGYSDSRLNTLAIERELELSELDNISVLITSVYNGLAYYHKDKTMVEERDLAEVLTEFLD